MMDGKEAKKCRETMKFPENPITCTDGVLGSWVISNTQKSESPDPRTDGLLHAPSSRFTLKTKTGQREITGTFRFFEDGPDGLVETDGWGDDYTQVNWGGDDYKQINYGEIEVDWSKSVGQYLSISDLTSNDEEQPEKLSDAEYLAKWVKENYIEDGDSVYELSYKAGGIKALRIAERFSRLVKRLQHDRGCPATYNGECDCIVHEFSEMGS